MRGVLVALVVLALALAWGIRQDRRERERLRAWQLRMVLAGITAGIGQHLTLPLLELGAAAVRAAAEVDRLRWKLEYMVQAGVVVKPEPGQAFRGVTS